MSDSRSRREFLANVSAAAVLVGCKRGEIILDETDDETGDSDTGDTGDSGETDTDTDPGPPEVAFEPDTVTFDEVAYPLAVQAGAMRTESVVLATWTADPVDVAVRVWQVGATAGVVLMYFDQTASPDRDGYLRVPVTGLRPGEWFEYGFFQPDGAGGFTKRSLIGRVRTALADDVSEPLTMAITSCQGSSNDPWPALSATATHDYDLFLHLGDMAYNDGAVTLDEYRQSWKWYLSGAGFREAYAAAGLYATWDDHEVDNDWDPETIDPTQLANAKQAFFEAIAVERGTDDRLWNTYRWGLTAEILLLDCRSERKPSTRNDANAEYISVEQMTWLKDRLSNSPCHFKVIMNSVPITDMPLVWDVKASDRWEGYAAQRQELLDHILDNGIDNVWFLSGDFHVCFVARVEKFAVGVLEKTWEIAATGGNTNPLGLGLTLEDQFDYGTSEARVCLLTFDPTADSVRIRFLDPSDGSAEFDQTYSQSA